MNIINFNITKFKESKFDKQLTSKQVLTQYQKNEKDQNIMHFDLNQKADPFSFHGIKVIYCDNPNLLIRDLLNENDKYSKILINDEPIKNSNIFYINPFTKISDLLTLKSSGRIQKYLEKNDLHTINQEIEEFIIQCYANIKDDNLEELSNINLKNASILNFIEMKNDYLKFDNVEYIFNILNETNVEKPLIIINDYQFVKLEDILNRYLDQFNFLIFTTNFKNWINQVGLLELLIIMKDIVYEKMDQGAIEILDKKILIDYLEEVGQNKLRKSELKSWLLEKNL